MTLEEAIEHAENAAKNNEKKAVRFRKHGGYVFEDEARECEKCANEHRQLAEWLKELQAYRKDRRLVRMTLGRCASVLSGTEAKGRMMSKTYYRSEDQGDSSLR